MLLAVGTFTDGFMGGAPSEGLYVFDFDPKTGESRLVQIVRGLLSPSYLARHPVLPVLFAAERQWSKDDASQGALTSFAVDRKSGALEQVDRRPSGGAFTAHVSVSPDGRLIALANPLGPSIAVFRADNEGLPGDAARFTFTGQGARPRQSAPWPHSCWFDPAARRMFVCDLGLDRIFLYDVARDIIPGAIPFAQVSSGAGARHMAIRPDGSFAYVANELDGSVSVFAIDDERGSLAIVQTIDCTAEGCQPAEIVCSGDGRSLHITLRGPEVIASYNIDEGSGRLSEARYAACLGNTPRHIALSQDGSLAFVSNQLSGEVVVFARNDGGTLTPTGARISVPSPSCVVVL
jgi:6-phosphogluconolactonase